MRKRQKITRTLQCQLVEAMGYYPIVTLTGPRQSGKTTLAKMAAPLLPYVNLENPKDRELATYDPESFLARYPDGAILDEIQRVPQLASWLQTIVDADERKGLFLLTGSHNFAIKEMLSQSLAGRTAILNLLPFSLEELLGTRKQRTVDEMIFEGFYPRILEDRIPPNRGYADYVETYLERDLGQLLAVKDLAQFRKFLSLCAGRVSQIFNKANLANDIGMSEKTIEHWVSILEASWILFRLPPYSESTSKRLTKSPKLYFYDVGLACYLLGIEDQNHLPNHPLRGSLFENLVVTDLLKARLHRGQRSNLCFFRNASQTEVDLVIEACGAKHLVEIKSSNTWHDSFLNGIRKVKKGHSALAGWSWIVYGGVDQFKLVEDNGELVSINQLGYKAGIIVNGDRGVVSC